MIGLGTTLRCNLPPQHFWVVISDPIRTGGEILLVNFTTLTEDCVDDTCILNPAEFELLTQDTTVAYSRSQVGTVTKLDLLIRQGTFTLVTGIPPATLQRILLGARKSRELSSDKKRLIG